MPHGQRAAGGTASQISPQRNQARIVARATQLRDLGTTLRQRLTAAQTTQAQLAEALAEV